MRDDITREQIVEAMRARMEQPGTFQAKHLEAVGVDLLDARYTKSGEPVARIADKLLQTNRKYGSIEFHNGWWSRTRQPLAPT